MPGVRRYYWRFAPTLYRWNCTRRVVHEAPLDPLQLRYVNPDALSRLTGRNRATEDRWRDVGTVRCGDWDRNNGYVMGIEQDDRLDRVFTAETFEETVLYQSFEAHLEHGVPWEDTDLFQSVMEAIEAGYSIWRGSQSRDDLFERCRTVDQLYETIKTQGYKTQMELREAGGSYRDRVGYLDVLTDEVAVDVARDGEFLFVDGRHRLAIAKLLGIDRIPVLVLVRHCEWMDHRDRLSIEASSVPAHPDLVELRY